MEAKKREQLSAIDSLIRQVNIMDKKEFGNKNTGLDNWFTKLMDNRRKVEAGQAMTIVDYMLPTMISLGMPQVEATLVGIKQRKEEEERQRHADFGNHSI